MPQLSVWTYVLVCPMLFLAGLVDSVAGGGGLISLPAYLLAGLPPHFATATNKCSSTFGTMLSTARYLRHGHLHRQTAALSVVCALSGSWLGARLNLWLPEKYLYCFLLAALPVIALVIIFKRDLGNEDRTARYSKAGLLARCGGIALAIGCYDGFFGPGTGTFLMLALTGLCGFDLLTAAGNTKVINLSSNLAALVTFLQREHPVGTGHSGGAVQHRGQLCWLRAGAEKRRKDHPAHDGGGAGAAAGDGHLRSGVEVGRAWGGGRLFYCNPVPFGVSY